MVYPYNHIGIGICGEPCPPQCRTCNKQVVQDEFYGNEDKPYSRFVYLPDCDHLCKHSFFFHYYLLFSSQLK